MERLTAIDKKILARIANGEIKSPSEITEEQYRATIWHLSELELINAVYNMGGFVVSAIITDKGLYYYQNQQ